MRGVGRIRRYPPALLWRIQRRVGGGRGVVVSVETRGICGVDKQRAHALRCIMMSMVEEGLARQRRKGESRGGRWRWC
ncbi:MAG: hypothetical protein ACO2PN_09440 [Pyrobaculum sp.]